MNFTHGPISSVSIIFSKDIGEIRIRFAKISHNYTEEFVLLAVYSNDNFTIGMSTILIPNLTGDSYVSAETDIGIINKGDDKGTFNTQELVYQNFAQDLCLHYHNLRKVIIKLMQRYNDEGLENVVRDYERLIALLNKVGSIIRSRLSAYNGLIDRAYAVIFNERYGPSNIRSLSGLCDSAYIYAFAHDQETPPYPSAGINGGVELWLLTDNFYWTRFEGALNVEVAGTATYATDEVIDFLHYELYWGVGYIITSGGEGYTWVMFHMYGLAVWTAYTSSYFYGVPGDYTDVSVSAHAGEDSDYDWASLQLCGGS
jgi:hypothetical protein